MSKKYANASMIVYERVYHFLRFRAWAKQQSNRSKSWHKWANKYSSQSLDTWQEYDNHSANMALRSFYMVRHSVITKENNND